MSESDLKELAIKRGLKIGGKVKVQHFERIRGTTLKKTLTGTVTALYPYHFTIILNKNNRIVSCQYKQEVALCGE